MQADIVHGEFMSDPERCSDLLNGVAFGGRQVIKPEDIRDYDTQLNVKEVCDGKADGSKGQKKKTKAYSKKYRDIVRKVACGVNFAVVGIENQSEVHYLMPVRVMDYDVSEYKRQAAAISRKRKKKGTGSAEFLSKFSKEDRLMPCMTFVLYYGKDWDGSKSLRELLDFADIPEEFRKYVADYSVNLINVREIKDTSVFKSDIRQVFDFIKYSEDKEKLRKLVESDEAYRHMDETACEVMALYAKSDEIIRMLENNEDGGEVDMCKALKDWAEEERAIGREEGERLGRAEGERLGRAEGETIGMKQGVKRGERLAIIKLVRSKLIKGFTIMSIADLLEESVDAIRSIADTITANPMLTDEEIVKNYL